MREYWLSPRGELYLINKDISVMIIDNPDFKDTSIGKEWIPPFSYVPNGKHSKLTPNYHTGAVTLVAEGSDSRNNISVDYIHTIFYKGIVKEHYIETIEY